MSIKNHFAAGLPILLLGYLLFLPSSVSSQQVGRTELIVVSSLPTPPPGYLIEKTFGNPVAIEFDEFTVFFGGEIPNGIYKKIVAAELKLRAAAAKLGANAILNERVDVGFVPGSGKVHFLVTLQGEAVLLKPTP